MFTINNTELRNIQEQVQKNKEDIANHYAIDRSLANFGIKIVGTVSTPEQLPDPLTYGGEYGDGYAVGQPGSYIYYIFTRPDPNSGQFDNYWLDVGSISVVGPEGPEGPKGDKGDTGESTKWYTGQYEPSNPNVGDMYLNNQGQVFQYTEDNVWLPTSDIKGPQGIQGIQGIPGPQGEQGIQGPKGDTGDVGGFINLYGILQNTNQLPSPQSLDNPTISYLIEHTGGTDNANDHYDLYVQIGDSSETRQWSNVGPFNAATLVTVNGLGQNVWNADTKIDKQYPQSNCILTVSGGGTGEVICVQYTNSYPFAGSFYRCASTDYGNTFQGSGTFLAPEPTKNYQVANKKYVDENFAPIKSDTQGTLKTWVSSGATSYWTNIQSNDATAKSGYIAQYLNNSGGLEDRSGWLTTSTPVNPYHAANKTYVDNKFEQIFDAIYPVGSLYMSVNTVSPETLFGGTWEQIKDTFLLASGDTYTAGATGGSATHSHTLGSGYATISPKTDGYAYCKVKTDTGSWAPNLVCTNGDVYTDFNDYGVNGATALGGSTDTTNTLPPYLTINVWKRTA